MFLRRVVTSALVVAVFALVGVCGNSVVLTRERTELAYNRHNLVRLHIIANSDSAEDQRIKLRVRDALVERAQRLFLNQRDPAAVLHLARSNREAFAALAAQTARRAGAHYGAKAEVGTYEFPARTYPFGVLPAGRYQAVRIVLGRGAGHNWWCVLFPPLCFLSPGGSGKNQGPIRFRLLFLERLLHRNGLAFDAFWRGWARFWRLPVDDRTGTV